MLMRPLQRGQRESVRRNQLRFTQRVPLARAVTMQRNQERRWLRRRGDHVVVQIDLRSQRSFDCRGVLARSSIHGVAYNMLTATARNRLCIRLRGKLRCSHRAVRIEINLSEDHEMKFPGGLNIQAMMKQAQQMQEKMAQEMEEMRVEASAGGGVVNVTMKGDHEIISLKVDPEIVKENDIEMLQDMIVAAINEGNRKVNEAMKSKLGSMLPPGLGNLF